MDLPATRAYIKLGEARRDLVVALYGTEAGGAIHQL